VNKNTSTSGQKAMVVAEKMSLNLSCSYLEISGHSEVSGYGSSGGILLHLPFGPDRLLAVEDRLAERHLHELLLSPLI
jgi:hypothetical protein